MQQYLTITNIIIAASLIGVVAFLSLKNNHKSDSSTNNKPTNQTTTVQVNLDLSKKQQKTTQQPQSPNKDKKKKNKKKKPTKQQTQPNPIKTQKQIQQLYAQLYYGSINLKPQQNSIHGPTSIAYKNSKILVGTTKNQLILYDLKKWKKQDPKTLQKYFVSLDNNTPTAVCIGSKYYYAALGFDKTLVYFEYVGEKGVYFQEVKRFYRNILKSDASAIYVPDDQKYIITSGTSADTTLNVWSMKGQKLHTFNTYQIEHYDIKFCLKTIMVRGWTSQVKIFHIETDKTGGFSKIEKGHPLSIPDQPLCSSIDNLGLYGLTVSKQYKITLWDLQPQIVSKSELKVVQGYQIDMDVVQKCLVHTLKDENQRYKTFIILSDKSRIMICDQQFNVMETIAGIQCKNLEIIGSMKNAVLITQNKQDKLIVWNITKVIQKIPNYAL